MPRNSNEFQELIEVIQFLSQRGWVPATSSNFSIAAEPGRYLVSVSGVDKSKMSASDFMAIDIDMKDLENSGKKPSAESLIHLEIYANSDAKCVLHTHSPTSTVLSMAHAELENLTFSGYELAKALPGNNSHENEVVLPIFENSQDMVEFSKPLSNILQSNKNLSGFLIRGHGLYAWGDSVFAAKRHLEAFEFLMSCRLLEMQIR